MEMVDLPVWGGAGPPVLQVVTGPCIAVGLVVCVRGSEAAGLGMPSRDRRPMSPSMCDCPGPPVAMA